MTLGLLQRILQHSDYKPSDYKTSDHKTSDYKPSDLKAWAARITKEGRDFQPAIEKNPNMNECLLMVLLTVLRRQIVLFPLLIYVCSVQAGMESVILISIHIMSDCPPAGCSTPEPRTSPAHPVAHTHFTHTLTSPGSTSCPPSMRTTLEHVGTMSKFLKGRLERKWNPQPSRSLIRHVFTGSSMHLLLGTK